jgi:hypothetical protein
VEVVQLVLPVRGPALVVKGWVGGGLAKMQSVLGHGSINPEEDKSEGWPPRTDMARGRKKPLGLFGAHMQQDPERFERDDFLGSPFALGAI